MDEKLTWNPTWQVWKMLVGIVGNLFGAALEARHEGVCGGGDTNYNTIHA